jgi:hypothetical protein
VEGLFQTSSEKNSRSGIWHAVEKVREMRPTQPNVARLSENVDLPIPPREAGQLEVTSDPQGVRVTRDGNPVGLGEKRRSIVVGAQTPLRVSIDLSR